MIRNIFRRILSVASALAIVFTAYPPVIFADDGGLCPHHPEHTAECGYVEGVSPCNFVCEICNPPEASDSTEPSSTPEPEVTTSPEEQPSVTTAPEPEPVETGTTETMPEESETLPTEPLPEPNFSPLALNDEHLAHDNITDWQAWDNNYDFPNDGGNYYLTIDMKTVDVYNYWYINKNINLCLNGHEFETGSYNVDVGEGGNLTVYDCGDGRIFENYNDTPIRVDGGIFTLQSGSIEAKGFGISIDSYDTSIVVINGDKVTGRYAIYANCGTIKVNGGTLSGTEYGIYFVPNNAEGTNIISLSGSPTIEGGIADIYLHDGAKITVDSQLTATDISIKMETPGVFATGAGAAASVDCFTSADPKYAVRATSDGQLELVEVHRHADGKEFTAWTKNNELPTEPGDYYLTQNVTIGNILQLSGEVSICLNGHKIDCGGSGCLFVNGGSLTIYDDPDKEGEITGSGIAFIQCQGKVIINSGKISHSSGKPIFVTGSGNLTINGGEIIGSSTGVEVQGGTLIVNGGTIKSGGTTIIFDSYANVIINGGIIQSTNSSAVTNYGNTSGKLTIHGGEFTAGDNAQVVVLLNSDNGNITLSGSPTFSGGKVDISLLGTAKIEFDNSLTTENIRMDTSLKNQAFTVNASTYGITADKFTFVDTKEYKNPEDKIEYEVQKVGSELWLVPKGAHVHEDDGTFFEPWDSSDSLPTEGNYYLTEDVTLNKYWEINYPKTVNLCLNGFKITVNSTAPFNIYAYSHLTVYDCRGGGEIDGNAEATINAGNTGAHFTLESGKISNNNSSGSAISASSGEVIINGGEVYGSNNGISISRGTVTITDGIITAEQNYAINVAGNGTLTLSGKPELNGGAADIYINHEPPMTIRGLTNEEPYSVAMDTSGTFATVESGLASDYVKNFTSAKDGYDVVAEGNELIMRLKTYTIKYEPGEGDDISGDSLMETKTHGEDITISSEKFTRPGYTQIGWATVQGASKVEYAFDADYTDNADLTLYPVWEKNEIHFYNGVEEIESLSLKVGESAEISVKITPENAVCGTVQWNAENGITINPNTGETVTVTGDSAGEFELTASTDDGLTAKTLTVTVTRFDSAVSAENQTVTYGDDVTITAKVEKAVTNGISLMSNYDNKVTFKLGDNELGTADVVGDTAILTVPVTRANGFAIGDNTVTLEYSGNSVLEYAEGSVTVTVNKKTLTAAITGTTSKTYDGTASTVGLELELSGVVEGDTVGASAEFAFDSANAGERTISAANAKLDGKHAGYYELSTPISISGTISPLPAEFVWTGDEFVYDGNSHEVTATVKNAVGDDEFKLTYSGNTATEAGDYTAKVTALGNENYTLSGATGIEHKWKITALSLADAQVEIVGTYTYNGEVQTPEIRITLGGKVLSAGDYSVTYSGEVKNADTYTVTLTGIGNYSGSASAEFVIAQKFLTASISGTLSKVYDGTVEVNDDVKIALSGVVKDDDVTATAEISYDSSDAGARKIAAKNISLGGKNAKNYTLASNQAEISGSITPAPINLPNTEFIYSGEAKTVIQVSEIGETVTATLTAFSSDAGEYEYSEAAKEGSYTVELSSDNYAVSKAGVLTIKPLVAVLEWQSGEFTYDGNVHEVAATVKNAVAGDKFEIEYTGNAATNAGDYTAKVIALGNANYILNGAKEYEWKISPRVADIEWIGDEFTYDGKSHTVTATVKNAVAGDKFEIEYTGNTATEAGDYTAKVIALGNANYTLNGATGVEHTWKITAASQAAPEVKIDFINETLSTDETMEFTVDGETWHDCTAAMNVAKTGWNGNALTVKIRYKKDDNHLDGEIQSLVIPARRAAPDISETAVSKSQTEISIAEIPGCEYSLDCAAWQDSGSFSGLDKGETYEIFVRYKATVSSFASFVSQKTVVTSSTSGGTTELLPGETVAAGEGTITNRGGEIVIDDGESNETVITLPSDGSVEVDEQGNVIVPDGGTVTVGDNAPVTLPEGGSVETDGTVTADEVVIGDVTVKGEGVTVTPDGEITLPEGGSVEVDGEAVKIVPKGATVVDGEINAPAIAEPADGEGSIGDGIILSIESADELLKDNDRENLKEKENSVAVCAYDIKLLKNGEEIQPSKAIKLTVAASADGEKMKVFRLESDGTFTDMDAEFGIGSFSFITEHLSVYVLASEEGEVSSEVVVSDGAPEIGMSDEDRKALEDEVLTDEDLSAIENGDNVKVVMTVDGLSEEEVLEDELTTVGEFMGGLPDYEVAEYADITLTKITEDGVTGEEIKSEAIAEISKPIKLIFDVPEELYKSGRIFSVIRLHDGKAELLSDTDDSDETVTVLTDKFSLYVLIYRDPVDKPIHRHSFTAWINVGASGHLARCAICGEIMAFMPHTFMNGVCTACGYSAIFSQPFDESDVIEIEVPTEGMIANEEVVEF